MANGPINQHKQLAMGKKTGFAKGGSVVSPMKKPSGKAANPIIAEKMGNGVPGMKKGGRAK